MAPAGATNCRRGDLMWRIRGKKLRSRRKRQVIFGRHGWDGRADGRTWGKGEADGRIGGGWADEQTARRMEADERTSGQAHESGRGVDRAD